MQVLLLRVLTAVLCSKTAHQAILRRIVQEALELLECADLEWCLADGPSVNERFYCVTELHCVVSAFRQHGHFYEVVVLVHRDVVPDARVVTA